MQGASLHIMRHAGFGWVGTISLHILHTEQHETTGSSPRPVSWAIATASVWKSAR